MPIRINRCDQERTEIAWLCENDWELRTQLDALELWLNENRSRISKGDYVADIGYSIREGVFVSGAVLTITAMKMMSEMGIELWLSEYLRSEP